MDPFVVFLALPIEPRVGSSARAFGLGTGAGARRCSIDWVACSAGLAGWDRGLMLGLAARAVLANGAVFAQMPEGTVSGPAGRIGPFRSGAALIALRTGAPIVLLAMAGTEELYLGRRLAARILAPTSIADLLGPDWDGQYAAEGSRQELELARRLSDRFAERLESGGGGPLPGTIDLTNHPRRLRRRC